MDRRSAEKVSVVAECTWIPQGSCGEWVERELFWSYYSDRGEGREQLEDSGGRGKGKECREKEWRRKRPEVQVGVWGNGLEEGRARTLLKALNLKI